VNLILIPYIENRQVVALLFDHVFKDMKNKSLHLVPFSFRPLHTDNHWQMTSYKAASRC